MSYLKWLLKMDEKEVIPKSLLFLEFILIVLFFTTTIFDSTTYDKLIKSVLSIKKDETKYSNKCIRVTWVVRNLLTHSIGWPKPSIQEYDILFNYIFGAICYAIDGLYSKDSE